MIKAACTSADVPSARKSGQQQMTFDTEWNTWFPHILPDRNKHGNGVHHIGFEAENNHGAVIRSLGEPGFDTNRTPGICPGSSWTIVGSKDVLGVNLNIKPVR